MAPAFQSAKLPLVHRGARRQTPTTCSAEAPRATKLSLPTYRERRYLQDNYVERTKGRATNYVKATAFTLMVWPLVVRELTADEADRRLRWLRRQRAEQERGCNISDEIAPALQEKADGKLLTSDAEEITVPDLGCEMVLEINHDSMLLDSNEYEQDSLLLEASKWDFTIPPWAYIVRVRAGKPALGKRAVQRNRAKRRIRAAASTICPDHASRAREYVFTAKPEALTIGFDDLVDEVRSALKRASCWEDELPIQMLRRERYCKW